ncbi:ROK family protein [soil metagenome]
MAGQVIAIDLGGTNIRCALVRADGHVEKRESVRTHAEAGPDAVIARIADVIGLVSVGCGGDVPVGIASPGPLDPRTGTILFTPNLPGWRDVPLVARVEASTGRRIALQNDGNCGALGEAAFGSARGVRNLVYLALGTGIGGGVISNGVLIDGAQGYGAEVGHVVVALDGPRCTCGSVGCLEAYTSGWAIRREAELVATTADGDRLKELAGNGDLHAGVVAEAASEGHPASLEIMNRAGRALGAAMGAFANIFNPSMIVVGGGVASIGETLLRPARAALLEHSFVDMRRELTVTYSSLGKDTGLLGAAALALRTFARVDDPHQPFP